MSWVLHLLKWVGRIASRPKKSRKQINDKVDRELERRKRDQRR